MKSITFKQFVTSHSFRYYRSDCESEDKKYNTSTIRIYYPVGEDYFKQDWFEFGIYDFGGDDYKLRQIKDIFSEKILKLYVSNFYCDDELDILVVHLTDNKCMDEVSSE